MYNASNIQQKYPEKKDMRKLKRLKIVHFKQNLFFSCERKAFLLFPSGPKHMNYKQQMAIMKFLILYNIMIEKLRYNNKEMKNEHNRAKIETLPYILTEL